MTALYEWVMSNSAATMCVAAILVLAGLVIAGRIARLIFRPVFIACALAIAVVAVYGLWPAYFDGVLACARDTLYFAGKAVQEKMDAIVVSNNR